MRHLFLSALAALALCPGAQADQVFNDDVIVTGDLLCVGSACINNESLIAGRAGLKVKDIDVAIQFIDNSTSTGFPNADWQLNANEIGSGSRNAFYLTNLTRGTTPVFINGNAPSNALFLENDGRVGFGTMLPQSNLHILSGFNFATLRLEESQNPTQAFQFVVDSLNGFRIHDLTFDRFPFFIRPNAPNNAVHITSNGNIGLGTDAPFGKLHTRGTGTQLAYFESSNGGAVQVRFRTDSENRRFLAVNNANEVKSQIVFGDSQIQFLGQTATQEWLRVSAAGIVSSGPTCNPNPCDATFDPEVFTVPPIEERAAFMWANQHLPAIGPTGPDQPMNMTEKMGGVIHELEVAHIYIETLHGEIESLKREKARNDDQAAMITALMARLEALEAQ